MQQTFFRLKKKYYSSIKELSQACNDYFLNPHAQRDADRHEALQQRAESVIAELTKELCEIKSKDEIDDFHFVYYRLLTYVYTLVSPHDSINLKRLFGTEDSEIEGYLRNGMRTGILGAFFSGKMYCFLNNHTVTKKSRGYFVVPLVYKEHKDWYMVVALERTKIPLRESESWVDRCSIYYDEIKRRLTS